MFTTYEIKNELITNKEHYLERQSPEKLNDRYKKKEHIKEKVISVLCKSNMATTEF